MTTKGSPRANLTSLNAIETLHTSQQYNGTYEPAIQWNIRASNTMEHMSQQHNGNVPCQKCVHVAARQQTHCKASVGVHLNHFRVVPIRGIVCNNHLYAKTLRNIALKREILVLLGRARLQIHVGCKNNTNNTIGCYGQAECNTL